MTDENIPLNEIEKMYNLDILSDKPAIAAQLPCGSGDGYGFGGGAIVVIGQYSMVIGEGQMPQYLAREIVRRWNSFIPNEK